MDILIANKSRIKKLSTKSALEYVSRAISIENNPARCYNLLNDPEAKESINTGKLLLACIPEQIGSNVSERSRTLQAQKYVNALDNFDDNFTADFIFVGGNYKVIILWYIQFLKISSRFNTDVHASFDLPDVGNNLRL